MTASVHPAARVFRSVLRHPVGRTRPRRRFRNEVALDPLDAVAIADPARVYRRLHERGGVHHLPRRDLWIVAGHEEVRTALRSHDAFSSADGVTQLRAALPMLLTMDRPDHTRLRRMVAPHFTSEEVRRRRPFVEQVADEAIDRLTREPGDAVAQLGVPVPVKVIAALLGVPPEDFQDFRRWSDAIVEGFNGGASLASTVRATPHILRGVHELHAYMRGQFEQRRVAPRDDLLSVLLGATEEGTLSDEELFWFVLLLLVAGNETTTNLIGVMLLALASDPDAFAALRRDRDLVPGALEEALRWGSPIQGLFRTVRTDFEIANARIPAGSRALLLFAAANRDPANYPDPDRFVVDRNPTDHLAFGHGIHYCLGAHLARMEAATVLERLLDRVERIELAGTPVWTANANLRGLTELPLRMVESR